MCADLKQRLMQKIKTHDKKMQLLMIFK